MLFAPKKVDPVKQVREWKRNINKEKRALDREILGMVGTAKLYAQLLIQYWEYRN